MDHGSRTTASVPAMTAVGLRFAQLSLACRAAADPGLRSFARSRPGRGISFAPRSRSAPAPLPLSAAALHSQTEGVSRLKDERVGQGGCGGGAAVFGRRVVGRPSEAAGFG